MPESRPETSRLTLAAVIPVYNQRETVCAAIDSVLAQTRPADEIIVVDDGSTDGSGDLVARQYGDRVRLIRQENRGAGGAFNTGIRAGSTDLISLLGADDGWMPDRLEKQVAFMEAHPDCMLSFTAAELRDEINDRVLLENTEIDKERYVTRYFFRDENLPAGNGVMVRREVFEELGYFDESLRRCQDTDMWLRIMIRYGFEHIPEPLVWVHRGQHRTMTDHSKGFRYHEVYYAKHRYTFGRGWRGQAIWRAGYGAALRFHAIWYFRQKKGGLAMRELMKAVLVWPFFNPTWVVRAASEYLLGTAAYDHVVSRVKRFPGLRPEARG